MTEDNIPTTWDDPNNPNDDHAAVYREGDTWIFRASQIMVCEKALIGLRLGFERSPTPRILRDAYKRGVAAEPLIAEYMAMEWGPVQYGLTAELRVDDDIIIRGHPDGNSPHGVHEYKNMAPDNYSAWVSGGLRQLGNLGRKYAIQGLIYASALEQTDIIFAVRSESTGRISHKIYTQPELLQIAKISWDEIGEKLRRVVDTTEWTGCSNKDFDCPIWLYHKDGFEDIMQMAPPDLLPDFPKGTFIKLIRLQAAAKEFDDLKAEIKEKLGETPYNGLVEGIRVSYYSTRGRQYPNIKKMVEAGIDIEPFMEQSKDSWNLRIREE